MKNGDQLKPYEEGLYRRGFKNLAGVDEAGRGPLAGPVVAAAVILPRDRKISGIKDSKSVTAARREQLCRMIKEEAVAVAVEIVPEEVIDRINILKATWMAMAGAVDKLSVRPDYLLVDGLPVSQLDIPHWPIVGGDRHCASIAAASIVAKVYRDSLMAGYHEQYPQYNFIRNKGYGTAEHRRLIALHGPCPIHRRTFRGVREYLAAADG